MDDVGSINQQIGVPRAMDACHTAMAGGYLIVGHVPAELIKRLLEEKPKVAGIAVPGMPAGSPGMPSAHPQPYTVYTFDKDGRTAVYAKR